MSLMRRAVGLVVPNVLSFARLGLAAWFPWVPEQWRVWVIVAAALSDAFDGKLSRLLHAQSTFGQVLDPIADKAFVAAVLVTLLSKGQITWLQLALVGFRDLAVVVGSLGVVLGRGPSAIRHLPPRFPGKLATAGQFLFLADVVYHRVVRDWLFGPVALISIVAGLDYLIAQRRSGSDRSGPSGREPPLHATSQLQHP